MKQFNSRRDQMKDEKGGMWAVTIPNVFQSNGVIHVVDRVVMPN
jgi:uncharacterized surface protein with fasciclin (FAS1) repeats